MPSVSLVRPLLGRAVGATTCSILNLDVLLGTSENIPYLCDFKLHQMLVERVNDLYPTNGCSGENVVLAVIYQNI